MSDGIRRLTDDAASLASGEEEERIAVARDLLCAALGTRLDRRCCDPSLRRAGRSYRTRARKRVGSRLVACGSRRGSFIGMFPVSCPALRSHESHNAGVVALVVQ
jgi:hypothetical protein